MRAIALPTFLALPLLVVAAPVQAGDQPLVQPPPPWIAATPLLDTAPGGLPVVLDDQQVRIEKGKVWAYTDRAVRADTPEALTQLGTLAVSWSPDKGDVLIHRAVILREGQEIDLLKGGSGFTVLQREKGLERRVLDGTLTATLPVTGLQVGDVLRFTFSVVRGDPALRGHVQEVRPLPAAPSTTRLTRMRISWPAGEAVQWRAGPGVTIPEGALRTERGYRVLTVPVPLPKRDPLPGDAPFRYTYQPSLQLTDFAGWADLSRTMAPLFATEGTIRDGDPIAIETDAIAAASPDPRQRAARALELVQSRISYLLLGMNGGNYVPQAPAETWTRRYGDCKAKTLLLLAMLRRMGIEAEPALVTFRGGDALPGLLPMAGVFDHVIVHARIAGKDLWLDGTASAARLPDIEDVPGFVNALPLRPEGSELMPLVPRRPERPEARVTLHFDESAGLDMPMLVDIEQERKGAAGAQLALAAAQASPEKRDTLVLGALGWLFAKPMLVDGGISSNPAAGTTTVRARLLLASPWKSERQGAAHTLEVGHGIARFAPDRARAAWRDIPVRVAGPESSDLSLTIALPEGGRGFRLEGDADFTGTLAGEIVDRHVRLDGGTVDYRVWHEVPAGTEVPPSEVAAAKAAVSRFLARGPLIRAPRDALRYWQQPPSPDRARFAAIDKAFAAAIARKPDDVEPLAARARFRRLTEDRKGAYADFAQALALRPTVALYAARADMFEQDGKYAAALGDAAAALDIDPANNTVAALKAHLLVRLGRTDEALALRDEALDRAGPRRAAAIVAFAEVQAEAGRLDEAMAALDEAAQERPGSADILNTRCWLKGTRQAAVPAALESGLKDCTRAIELAETAAAALDSRAMIYFRMGREDEALADLDAALDAEPALAGSLFMRGLIRSRRGASPEGAADLAAARRLDPSIDRRYAEWGIRAPG